MFYSDVTIIEPHLQGVAALEWAPAHPAWHCHWPSVQTCGCLPPATSGNTTHVLVVWVMLYVYMYNVPRSE